MQWPDHAELDIADVPIVRQIAPRPFRWAEITPTDIAIAYDRPSDTLLIHLFGRGRPAVSVPVQTYLYALVDPESEQIIGVHIEGFLAQAVKQHPEELTILDHAELRGITPIEVRAMQREMLGSWRTLPGQRNAVAAPQEARDKMEAITRLLAVENVDWGVPGAPAA